MSAPTCPACRADMDVFLEVDGVPVNSCLLVEDRETALAFPTGDLRLGFCPACGFIANTAFDPSRTTYDPSYEETQGFSPRFRQFLADLAERWVADYDLHGKDVLEIGCGKGEFLALLAELGDNRCTGIDPGVAPERLAPPARGSLTFLRDVYENHLDLPTDALVCRHTLEHLAPVLDWMLLVRGSLGDRTDVPVLFELPDTLRVLEEGAFWDVYYEHCSYFTPGSLSRLFRRAGFAVKGDWLGYDDQYILLEAVPGEVDTELTEQDRADVAATAAAVERFRATFEATVRRWREELGAEQAAGRRTVLWGGGSKAVAFLTTLGVADAVSGVVDINPHKQGKAVPGAGHVVLAPEELVADPPDLVVVANPVYLDEVRAMLDGLGLAPHLTSLGGPA